jgi:hypothetical protein
MVIGNAADTTLNEKGEFVSVDGDKEVGAERARLHQQVQSRL